MELDQRRSRPKSNSRGGQLTLTQVLSEGATQSTRSVWQDEARLRATAFLQLALVDSIKTIPSGNEFSDCAWDHRSVSKLARCYRSLRLNSVCEPFECGNILRDTLFGLAAAYRPVVLNFDLQVSFHPTLLGSHECRALALFTNCLLQGMLERASGRGGGGKARLKLNAVGRSMTSLLIQTSDPVTEIYSSSGYEIASRLAAKLNAEFVCRQGPANGNFLEVRFATGKASTAGDINNS